MSTYCFPIYDDLSVLFSQGPGTLEEDGSFCRLFLRFCLTFLTIRNGVRGLGKEDVRGGRPSPWVTSGDIWYQHDFAGHANLSHLVPRSCLPAFSTGKLFFPFLYSWSKSLSPVHIQGQEKLSSTSQRKNIKELVGMLKTTVVINNLKKILWGYTDILCL
jgi:hypothetical protein